MLKGTITYLDKHKYSVYGYDTASDMKLRLESGIFDDILFMADPSGVEQGGELWERGVSISSAKITVETGNEIDKNTGKKVKYPINIEFFCRLGATFRYLKSHCYTRYMEGYTGLKLASGEFEPEARVKYHIPFEDSNEEMAVVELRLGNVVSIKAKTQLFTIDLQDDPILDTQVYPVFKDGVQKGFAFTEEYLGFTLKPQVIQRSSILGGMYKNLKEVMDAHPEKEFSWLLDKDYRIVTDETLEEVCDYIYNYDGLVYYDTETTGLNINFKSRIGQADQCVGIILSVRDGESFFFPMQMKAIKNLCNGDHVYFMEHYMRRLLEKKQLVAHNMSFDWKVAYIYDINANIVHDTMAIFRLTLGTEDENMEAKLKVLAKLFLHRDSLELDDLVVADSWGEDDIRFWDLPEELVRLYACADTDNTRGLFKYAEQNNLLQKYNATKVYEIEIAFSYAVAYQEFYGHLFDVNKVEELREEIGEKMKTYYKQMVDIVGHDFNPNSSPQLLKIMYDELGIPVQISRKTNRPTTDKDTLKHLGELTNFEGKIMYPFCAILLKYREYEGVRKIIDKFPELATSDGYLFPGVQQYGTRTGRVSIKAPNYQSYNKPVKKNIIPRPGYYMFDTDYSSIEYRVLGNMSGNKMIKENFYDPDFDYHTYQASRMYRVPYASVTGALRKAAKGINFGLPYGMGDESLGIRIFGEKSDENTRKATALRRSYFKGQEDIQDFFENARDNGVQNKYTSTYFGRRRYYDSKRFSEKAIRRQAGNQVIQGCIGGETLIHTREYGIVEISSVVGEYLNVWDGKEWTGGDVTYSGKKRKCIVKFKGGHEMVCSPNHKFLLSDGKFVRCDELKSGCSEVVINRSYMDENDEDETMAVLDTTKPLGKLYRDTERLRRHLYNLFNQHGCFEGDRIVLKMSESESPQALVKDVQLALLFFGIRSNFSAETNRFVLRIESDDTKRFYRLIGFGIMGFRDMWGIKDPDNRERTLLVESVEITDEEIDMYDVCNTDRGYFVADGVITHNSAADIYKLAVGRVFKRICREGWLGKVILTGFIHDELLGEVSTEIDPMIWLKTLREEFEVKIYDHNGEPWCPLYMGFGWGRSWEEAKSTEIPIKLQWEFVEKYGETGFPSWDKDINKFCDQVPDMIRDFEIRDCGKQLLAEENQGKEIKPALNSAILGVLKEDSKYYSKVLEDESLRDTYHISGTIKDDEGNIIKDVPQTKDTQEAITYFCMLHGFDRSKIDVLSIKDSDAPTDKMASEGDVVHDDDGLEDEALLAERRRTELFIGRIKILGMYVDNEAHEIVGLLLPMTMMNVLKGRLRPKESFPEGYAFKLVDLGKNMKYNTPYVVRSADISGLQEIYATYMRVHATQA